LGFGLTRGGELLFSAITLEVCNIAFLVEPGSNVAAINASALQNCIIRDVSVIVNTNPGSEAAPSNPQFTAIKLPGTGNYGIVKCANVYVEGFYCGIEHSEHADIEALINQCIIAIRIPQSYSHLAKYKITTQRCSYSLWCDAQTSGSFPFSNSVWGTLDIERDPNFPFKADFFVGAQSMLSGFLFYNVAADPESLYSVAGQGVFNAIVQSCSMTYRKISADTVVSCNGWFFPVIPENLSRDVRVDVLPGKSVGQRLRIYGSAQFSVVVVSSALRDGNPFHFSDGAQRATHTIAAGADGGYLELMWGGAHWLASVMGGSLAEDALRRDQPLALGQFSSEGDGRLRLDAGKVTRNLQPFPITLYLPIEFEPDASRHATAALSIGPAADNLRPAWVKDVPAGFPRGMIDTASVRVPAGWYYRLEMQNASIKDATIVHF